MAEDDTRDPPRASFPRRRAGDCEDEVVREFMRLAGWIVESNQSAEKHKEAWIYLLAEIAARQRRAAWRPAIVIGLIGAVVGPLLTFGLPVLWQLLHK